MKRMVLILIGLLLIGGALAEEATLSFPSFDGGGHIYTAEVEDPEIAAVSVNYDYGDIGDEPIEGASYDAVFTFTGLKQGATRVTIYGRSPIAENDDRLYTLAVDEALNVTLTPVRAISTFYLYRNGDMYYAMYHITREPDGYHVSIDEGEEQGIAAEAMDALADVIDAWDVASWDGFSESRQDVLDGEGFWLEFTLTDGTHALARGDNAFPEHYFDAMGDMWEILENAEITPLKEDDMSNLNPTLAIEANGHTFYADFEDNSSAQALMDKLSEGPVELNLHDYGDFEKVGPLPWTLPRNDESITTVPGDVILYQGNQITLYYDENTWNFTRLARIDGVSREALLSALGEGDVAVKLWVEWSE